MDVSASSLSFALSDSPKPEVCKECQGLNRCSHFCASGHDTLIHAPNSHDVIHTGSRVHFPTPTVVERIPFRLNTRDAILLQDLDVWSGFLPQDYPAGSYHEFVSGDVLTQRSSRLSLSIMPYNCSSHGRPLL